ncbi:hypothetical protein GJA_1781 [Janthinobacterium agaricidamnosum NBRC 102515 = DSM 9628]|uniref:Uncharacterized protein n=1 Tax=Janthinobacterium agaricidamnosum NBRC 102515 = DSM 9628 TaxID=1349767 RepID=W0V3H3_9BURK|nr:hypothetical protein GJA_1781 [Janthinobacterium agaricidamnosum NBRC 102515 = DSM 9628]
MEMEESDFNDCVYVQSIDLTAACQKNLAIFCAIRPSLVF